MRVKEIMSSPPPTVGQRVPLAETVERMKKDRVSKLVVVEGEKIVGVLTEKDIAKKVEVRRKDAGVLTVGDIMTPNPITVDPGLTAKRAAEIMLERNIGCLPVVEESKSIGVVTKLDFAKVCLRFDDVFVGEIMRAEPRTVRPDERFSQCRRVMIDEDLAVLPVADKAKLIGSIFLLDIAEKLVLERPESLRMMVAKDMLRPATVVRTNQSLAEVARLMLAEKIAGLPVVNLEDELVGLLTKTELVEVARERL